MSSRTETALCSLHPASAKAPHVFVQGELTTREYDRTIQVPSGKKTIEHVIQQLAVELKADSIRILDRASNSDAREAASTDDDVPL